MLFEKSVSNSLKVVSDKAEKIQRIREIKKREITNAIPAKISVLKYAL
jgi:hypothetical protein